MSKRFYCLIPLAVAFISSHAGAHEKITLNDIEICRAIDLSVDESAAAGYYVATLPLYEKVTDRPANSDFGIALNRHYVFEGQITERFLILGNATLQEKQNLVKAINQSLQLQGANYQCIQDLDS